MTIEAKIIADSIGPNHPRLTTMELRYPRFIHAEFMTHRMFSRNASSSRAIPVERQIEAIIEDTAMPIHWGKNQKGMQADEQNNELLRLEGFDGLRPWEREGKEDHNCGQVTYRRFWTEKKTAWLRARDRAIEMALAFHKAGYHKQIVNRILEPFSHIKVVVSATNYENFYWLRLHEDAQPEIRALADKMFLAQGASTPRELGRDEWHLPYVTDAELEQASSTEALIKVSVARSARVSYKTHDGKPTSIEADLALYDRLVGSAPLHASPAEHQAKLDSIVWDGYGMPMYESPHLSGNFDNGWIQYRKTLPGEQANVEHPLASLVL